MSIHLPHFEACQSLSPTSNTANSGAVVWNLTSTTNSKSSWTQIVASTASDIDLLEIVLKMTSQASLFNTMCVDIGIGGSGSEIVVVPDLVLYWSNTQPAGAQVMLPIKIPAGSRIAYRWQSNSGNTSDQFSLGLYGFSANFSHVQFYEAVGFDSSNTHGTQIPAPGASNTKGSYGQITASTSRDYVGFFFALDADQVNSSRDYMLDLAIGGAGSEVDIVKNYSWQPTQCSGQIFDFLPMKIKAGTRLSARNQWTNYVNGFVPIRITFYGAVG